MNIELKKSDIPLWSGGEGSLIVDIGLSDPAKPLAEKADAILDAAFELQGGTLVKFGTPGQVQLGVKAGTHVRIVPIWKSTMGPSKELVDRLQLAGVLDADTLVLVVDLGANADLSAAGSYRYSVLTASAELQAGVDAAYTHSRAYPSSTPLRTLLADFVQTLRLPETITTPPPPGDVTIFEFGGYLKVGASLSAGYEVKGTRSFDISQIQLSEAYDFSLIGRMGLTAKVAGRFAVEVRRDEDTEGWVRIKVRKQRARDMTIAADVQASATLDSGGLPRSGKEFLGALLGVETKNWLNVVDKIASEVKTLDDLAAARKRLDDLVNDFVGEWVGKKLDEVLPAEFKAVLGRVNKAVESYESLDDSAIALFDKYFDRLDVLQARLEQLQKLTSWDRLKGEIDPELWSIVGQLTDGDPLGWILGKIPGTQNDSLPKLEERVAQTLALIRDDAHKEIRSLVATVKKGFPLDHFMGELSKIDTIDELKAVAGDKVGHFISRLVGQALDKVADDKTLKTVLATIQKVAAKETKFWDDFDSVLQEAAHQSYGLQLHAEYGRADERGTLIDVSINTKEPAGAALVRDAGRGDFSTILARYKPALVKIHDGLFTHRVTRSSRFTLNVLGWHSNWNYRSAHQVVLDAKQQIRPGADGVLNVYTEVDLGAEEERVKNGGSRTEERMKANFMLRFLGETRGILGGQKFDQVNHDYLMDMISGQTATYDVEFTDEDTRRSELIEYLAFAKTLGLDKVGATMAQLDPLLSANGDKYGPIQAKYSVRFTESGLGSLFAAGNLDQSAVVDVLRRIILANYRSTLNRAPVAWAYCTDGIYAAWKKNPNDFESLSAREFPPSSLSSPIGGIAPPTNGVILHTDQLRFLGVLFRIQDRVVEALTQLSALMNKASGSISRDDFEKTLLQSWGELMHFDRMDGGQNTIFAVFDGLIQKATAGSAVMPRSCVLELTSKYKEEDVTKVFALQP